MGSYAEKLKTQGALIGPCNICGEESALTEDHIPPKGIRRPGKVAMMSILDLLCIQSPPANRPSSRISQNGVKYRTLCKVCNNGRLGTQYDPHLISFAHEVLNVLGSELILPITMNIKAQPNRIVRSVVGHLLAHGVNQHRTGQLINDLTDYFLDEQSQFPKSMSLYYWLYPYSDQIIIKGAGLTLQFFDDFAVFSLLKFYPLSFLIVLDQPAKWSVRLRRLDSLLSSDINCSIDIPLDLIEIPPKRWPEAPGDSGAVFHGHASTGAISL